MPRFGPISRRDLIESLRQGGFTEPYPGGRHEFMVRGTRRLILRNPHEGDVDRSLLARLLRRGGISREEWEAL